MNSVFLRALQSEILGNSELSPWVHLNSSRVSDVSAGDQHIAEVLSLNRKIVGPGNIVTTRGAAAAFPSLRGPPSALAFQLAYRKLTVFANAASSDPRLGN